MPAISAPSAVEHQHSNLPWCFVHCTGFIWPVHVHWGNQSSLQILFVSKILRQSSQYGIGVGSAVTVGSAGTVGDAVTTAKEGKKRRKYINTKTCHGVMNVS